MTIPDMGHDVPVFFCFFLSINISLLNVVHRNASEPVLCFVPVVLVPATLTHCSSPYHLVVCSCTCNRYGHCLLQSLPSSLLSLSLSLSLSTVTASHSISTPSSYKINELVERMQHDTPQCQDMPA